MGFVNNIPIPSRDISPDRLLTFIGKFVNFYIIFCSGFLKYCML